MKIFAIISFLTFTHLLTAQSTQGWWTNFDEAKAAAAEQRSNILLIFTGSDWCKSCMRFKKKILNSAEFRDYSKDKLVVMYVDFPARKKNKLPPTQTNHNEQLAEQFNRSGTFPNIFLMDAAGNILANPQFERQSVTDFIYELEQSFSNK